MKGNWNDYTCLGCGHAWQQFVGGGHVKVETGSLYLKHPQPTNCPTCKHPYFKWENYKP